MIKLINNNCFKVFPSIADETIDLIIVDPPYGINYKDWDKINFVSFTKAWLKECFRILKPTGTMWSFMGYQHLLEFIPLLQEVGLVHLENWVIWARQKGRGSSKHLKSQREDILHITKSSDYTWNNLKVLRDVCTPYVKDGKPRGWFINETGRRVRWTGLGNVWVYTAPMYNGRGFDFRVHSTQKPELLIERLILLSSNEGNNLLDPFAGSCITGLVSKNLNRNCVCIEQNKEYIKTAKIDLG